MDKIITKNQKKFFEEFDIEKTVIKRDNKKLHKYCEKNFNDATIYDNLKKYKNKDSNFIVIISSCISEDNKKMLIDNGWIETYPLHSMDTITYYKILTKDDTNAEKMTNKERLKKFYSKEENKYKLCDICGETYYGSSFSNHKKTKIHKKIMELKEQNKIL
jgi:hypothetical protein